MIDYNKIAEEAEVIISGYAFLRFDSHIKVVDLNDKKGVAVFETDGTLIETNMDDIQLTLTKKYLKKAVKYMEEDNAEVLSV